MRFRVGRALVCAALLFAPAGAKGWRGRADRHRRPSGRRQWARAPYPRPDIRGRSDRAAGRRPRPHPRRSARTRQFSPEVAAKARPAPGGLVSDFRFGSLAPGKSRLVIELGREGLRLRASRSRAAGRPPRAAAWRPATRASSRRPSTPRPSIPTPPSRANAGRRHRSRPRRHRRRRARREGRRSKKRSCSILPASLKRLLDGDAGATKSS